ncbi:hypothetical protein AK812_SmicGene11659 [Symbiodinium microadriaticum]|uniref:Uncharacterized protein n=1 Tax=Symbiodinium microadriaticum TaxID=2951 RepID=A0A1Q9ECR7_SYMMI|nr:hypothetical protein AK812_SmicGene11659 [Symbiodinium microadriaticum]
MARGWKARVVLKPAMTPLPCHLDLLASGRPPFPMRWGHGMGAWGYSNQVVERKLIQALREERRDMREKQTAIGEDAERQLQLQLPGMKRKRSPEPEAVCDAPARECNLSPATPMQDQPQEHITTPEKKAHTTPRITPEKTPRPTEADHASPLTAETTAVVVRAISKAFRSAGAQVLTLPAIDKVVKDLALGSSTQEILEKLESQNKVMVTDDLCFCIA